MANPNSLVAFAPTSLASSSARGEVKAATDLANARPGERVRITHIAEEAEHAAWLRAVGLHEDSEVTVLRRAAFGGPIHLRSRDGGEFAVHRDLARNVRVTRLEEGSASVRARELGERGA